MKSLIFKRSLRKSDTMKLSICIPVYNFDVRGLVFDLKREIENHRMNAEIILIDDASKESFNTLNREIKDKVSRFVFLSENLGRSRIRNLFLDFSTGEYLLFLDCDGKIIQDDFVQKYIQFIEQNPATTVIYGGREVPEERPDPDHYLRWKFAVERENLPVEFRKKKPYLSFQTNNFIIRKEVLVKVNFNPDYKKYGYEDLLFAMDLKSENIWIDHIYNPILNNDLENNLVYLGKVEESVESLSAMLKHEGLDSKLSEVKLVKMYHKINRSFLNSVFLLLFKAGEDRAKKKLLNGNIKLRYLDFYKLGLLLRKMKS